MAIYRVLDLDAQQRTATLADALGRRCTVAAEERLPAVGAQLHGVPLAVPGFAVMTDAATRLAYRLIVRTVAARTGGRPADCDALGAALRHRDFEDTVAATHRFDPLPAGD